MKNSADKASKSHNSYVTAAALSNFLCTNHSSTFVSDYSCRNYRSYTHPPTFTCQSPLKDGGLQTSRYILINRGRYEVAPMIADYYAMFSHQPWLEISRVNGAWRKFSRKKKKKDDNSPRSVSYYLLKSKKYALTKEELSYLFYYVVMI